MTYSYPSSNMRADYARAGIGVLITGGPALVLPVAPTVRVILLALALVFLGFAIHTAFRHRTRFTVTEQGISAHPRGIHLRWNDLTAVKLDYYSANKESRGGWMQLTLRSGNKRLRLDSHLTGFAAIAGHAAAAANANGLAVDPTSMSNFEALGLELTEGAEKATGVSDG
jgi:hypothetical protein